MTTNRPLFAHERFVRAVAFSPDSRTMASIDDGGMLFLWDLEEAAIANGMRVPSHQGVICGEALAFSPRGGLYVSEPIGTTLRNVETLAIENACATRVARLEVGGGGRWLLAGSHVREGGTLEFASCPPPSGPPFFGWPHGRIDPDGDALLLGDDGGYDAAGLIGPMRTPHLALFDLASGVELRRRAMPEHLVATAFDRREREFVFATGAGRIEAWAADGSTSRVLERGLSGIDALFCFGDWSAARIRNAKTGMNRLLVWEGTFARRAGEIILADATWLAASPDGRWLVWPDRPSARRPGAFSLSLLQIGAADVDRKVA